MYSFLEDGSSEHKKVNGANENIVTKISHSEYKAVLLKNKCLRHSMNKIQSRNLWNQQNTLTCFDDKIYILNSGYVGLALGY